MQLPASKMLFGKGHAGSGNDAINNTNRFGEGHNDKPNAKGAALEHTSEKKTQKKHEA